MLLRPRPSTYLKWKFRNHGLQTAHLRVADRWAAACLGRHLPELPPHGAGKVPRRPAGLTGRPGRERSVAFLPQPLHWSAVWQSIADTWMPALILTAGIALAAALGLALKSRRK